MLFQGSRPHTVATRGSDSTDAMAPDAFANWPSAGSFSGVMVGAHDTATLASLRHIGESAEQTRVAGRRKARQFT